MSAPTSGTRSIAPSLAPTAVRARPQAKPRTWRAMYSRSDYSDGTCGTPAGEAEEVPL